MSEDTWDVVVHGVAVNQETLEVRNITIGWRGGEDPCVKIFREEVGQATHSHGITDVDIATAFLFGPNGDGGGEQPLPVPTRSRPHLIGRPPISARFGAVPSGHVERLAAMMAEPITLGRPRRHGLQDRMARTYAELESFAAD